MPSGLLQRAWAAIACRRDPHRYHRQRGVRIGARVSLLGTTPHTFGSEPYLVTIGNDVTISSDVRFVTHDGGLRVVRRENPGAFWYAPITVEDGAFVGTGTLLLPGVTVGARSVVGARSLVTSDVPPDTVVAGTPARPIRSVAEYAEARRDEWIDTSGLTPEAKERKLRAAFGR